ncbi:MAG: ABATE domain-containing protein [Anaerolineae bacterium]|nr:ABATE domain-containing protein [Anaerolineae bacterium]
MDVLTDQHFPYEFVGGVLVLELVNTETIKRGERREFLKDSEALRWWWEQAQQQYSEVEQVASPALDEDQMLATLTAFRSAMRRLFTTVIERRRVAVEDLDTLNQALAKAQRSVIQQTDGTFATFYRSDDSTSRMVVPIALSAYRLLTEGDLTRLHKCSNDTCMRLFYDQTKNATRQWCTPKCLDKVRSRRRYALKKAQHTDSSDDSSA